MRFDFALNATALREISSQSSISSSPGSDSQKELGESLKVFGGLSTLM
jgi:hypothetical protein